MVSIVIPNYNYSKFLRDCLWSCSAQTYRDIEIIVVDDCSTDNSMVELWNYAVTDIRVKVHQLKENSGYSKAKNEAILEAKGEYIAFLDADDALTPKSVEYRVREFEANKKLDLVHGYCLKFHNDETYEYCIDNMSKLEHHKSFLHAQGIMVRRNVFDKYGLFFEGLRSKADKEMWYRLGVHPDSPLPRLIKSKHVDKPMAFYRRHPDAMHKMRVENKEYNEKIEAAFKLRIQRLKEEGVTRENTRFK
jgi:glycosyltransferase involved in cell wall biosynthesis